MPAITRANSGFWSRKFCLLDGSSALAADFSYGVVLPTEPPFFDYDVTILTAWSRVAWTPAALRRALSMLSAFLAQNLIERLRFAFMHFASMQGAAVLLGANSAATSFARSFFFFTLRNTVKSRGSIWTSAPVPCQL
jgi:hypothetical protein